MIMYMWLPCFFGVTVNFVKGNKQYDHKLNKSENASALLIPC